MWTPQPSMAVSSCSANGMAKVKRPARSHWEVKTGATGTAFMWTILALPSFHLVIHSKLWSIQLGWFPPASCWKMVMICAWCGWMGRTPAELDRVADTAFNQAGTEMWFKSQAPIPAGGRDTNYYLYYGNPSAGTPPANPVNVFALYDGFDDSVIDTALWNQSGTVTESDGWARLSSGSYLYGKQTFTYGLLEMQIQAVAEDNYMWWGWEDGPADAPNFMVFEEYPANLAALLRNDGGTYQTLPVTQPVGGLTSAHTYTTAWRPGRAAWSIDGVEVQSATTGLPDTPMSANFNANLVAFNLDWVRGRLLATVEPVVEPGVSIPGLCHSRDLHVCGF